MKTHDDTEGHGTIIICGLVHDEASASVGPDFVAPERCPKCNGSVDTGFGLMGGGFGSYWFCERDSCDWFAKIQSCPECDDACPAGKFTCDEHAEATP